MNDVEKKDTVSLINEVVQYLRNLGSAVIAYSGGVDSTLLLRLAKEADIKYTGVIIDTPLIPRDEVEFALNEADRFQMNCRQMVVDATFLDDIRFNPENRCYICKKCLFSKLLEFASEHAYNYVLDGSNVDDKSDYRPGAVAIKELGVKSPFAELGINKQQIRMMSKYFGMNNWAYPARACLASRIVYGDEITVEKLSLIESAEVAVERLLADCGLTNVQYRIRAHGDVARLEVPTDLFERIMVDEVRLKVSQTIKKCGFKYVAMDLDGYRMGSLNEVLN